MKHSRHSAIVLGVTLSIWGCGTSAQSYIERYQPPVERPPQGAASRYEQPYDDSYERVYERRPQAISQNQQSAGDCITGFRKTSDGRGNFRCTSQSPQCPSGLGMQPVIPSDTSPAQRFEYRCFRPER
jgi:hypothetical protein